MKSRSLTKEEILARLRKHNASEDDKVLRDTSYSLALAGVTEDTLMEKAQRAIQRLKTTPVQSSPLSIATKQAQAKSGGLSSCPICKVAMSSVKLLDEKPAWYCADHRIVVPKPTE